MKARSPIVRIDQMSFAYSADGPEVLTDFNWEFPQGTVTALLGPNGSGKTTLLNLVLGWLSPTAGCVRVNGRDRAETTRRDWSREVGLVPQEEPPVFELGLLEYTLLGRAPYLGLLERPGVKDRKAAEAALERTGLMKLWSRPVNALSGGERQLAAIARVLAQDPSVLLLDEPMSHLDLGNTRRILHILKSLRRDGKSVILTTHEPNIAAVLADEAVLLKEGRILAGGSAASVLNAENLSATYGVEVDVRTIDNRLFILPRL